MQNQSFAAVGVDQRNRALSCDYKTSIFRHVKLRIELILCYDSDQHCCNRILHRVVVLECLDADRGQ